MPQPRGVVSDADKAAIVAARQARDDADDAYREAVAAAPRHGASVREVAEFTGLAMQTVSDWGHARGWPTRSQEAHWDRMRPTRRKHRPS